MAGGQRSAFATESGFGETGRRLSPMVAVTGTEAEASSVCLDVAGNPMPVPSHPSFCLASGDEFHDGTGCKAPHTGGGHGQGKLRVGHSYEYTLVVSKNRRTASGTWALTCLDSYLSSAVPTTSESNTDRCRRRTTAGGDCCYEHPCPCLLRRRPVVSNSGSLGRGDACGESKF